MRVFKLRCFTCDIVVQLCGRVEMCSPRPRRWLMIFGVECRATRGCKQNCRDDAAYHHHGGGITNERSETSVISMIDDGHGNFFKRVLSIYSLDERMCLHVSMICIPL